MLSSWPALNVGESLAEPRAKSQAFKAELNEAQPAESAITLKMGSGRMHGNSLPLSSFPPTFKGYGPNEKQQSIELWIMNGSCKVRASNHIPSSHSHPT